MNKSKEYYMQNPSAICKDIEFLSRPMRACLSELGKLFGFVVVETWRHSQRQLMLVKTGKSWTMNSNHLTGDASDLMPIGGYDKPCDWVAMHDAWDKIVMKHHDPEWVVTPEKRIGKDMGHFGMDRKPRNK